MATTARKLRKRHQRESGTKFIHTEKVGTPYLERAVGPGMDRKGNQRPSVRQKKRLLDLHLAANPPAPIDEQLPLELDPKPYRVGRKRFTTELDAGLHTRIAEGDVVFSPRKQYEQDQSQY